MTFSALRAICAYDDKSKDYIIPTKSWIRAIEKYKSAASGDIILSNLLDKEQVLVKITNGKRVQLENINRQFTPLKI